MIAEKQSKSRPVAVRLHLNHWRTAVYLFTKFVPNLIQVFPGQKGFLTPVLNPRLIRGIVMQRKDGINILPLSLLGCEISPSILFGRGEHVINHTKPLSIGLRLRRGLSARLGVTKAIKPVANSVMISFTCQLPENFRDLPGRMCRSLQTLFCCSNKYKKRRFVAWANFC